MDDEVFKMVNIEGQVGFRRAGFGLVFFFLVYFFFFLEGECFYFVFQATTGSRSTVQSVGKEIPDQGKNKNSGMGRKEKSSKKHRSVNT